MKTDGIEGEGRMTDKMTDWAAYDALVAKQKAEYEEWERSEEGQKAILAGKEFGEKLDRVLRGMDPARRHYYKGIYDTLCYATAVWGEDHDGPYELEMLAEGLELKFSPSFSEARSESFYSPEPEPAADRVTLPFDPVDFLALCYELDEYGLMYWKLTKKEITYGRGGGEIYWQFRVGCTETNEDTTSFMAEEGEPGYEWFNGFRVNLDDFEDWVKR